MSRQANLIDGAYFEFILKSEFKSPKVDFGKLSRKIAGTREILRTYYYGCLPYQSSTPTREEQERFAKRQKFLNALDALPRFQVKQGRLEFRGIDKDGKPRFEQKLVDVLLAVDLVSLASKHVITDVAIIAGDSDFLPAIEAAKAEGVIIHLFHGANPHRELLRVCDERIPITQEFVDSIML